MSENNYSAFLESLQGCVSTLQKLGKELKIHFSLTRHSAYFA